MTKRFHIVEVYGGFETIEDNEGKKYHNFQDVCDLLNSQWEFSNTISNENYLLRMENEKLKHWNKCLAEKRHEEKEHNDSLIKNMTYECKENLLFHDKRYKTNMMKFDDIIKILNEQENEIKKLQSLLEFSNEQYGQKLLVELRFDNEWKADVSVIDDE